MTHVQDSGHAPARTVWTDAVARRIPRRAVALLAEDHEPCGLDVDREEMKLGFSRRPVDARLDHVAVARAARGVSNVDCPAVELEVPLGAAAIRDHTVDDAARIAHEVERLQRALDRKD
jgi:hypothetical protein